ncbi:hypothetical protein [Edaphobacter aggregans]|uniref:hypothetical protein n=1 Tax=Edaphobacter aggregans TaxID=570835 RepID=UPI000F736695|nr:hypothetical protein [Edaphobacter aggregans]
MSQSGVATTHIFDYPAATSLTLTLNTGTADTASQQDHYHFHTTAISDTPFDHAPMMFDNLLGLIRGFDQNNLGLLNPNPESIDIGDNVPASVSGDELEITSAGASATKPKEVTYSTHARLATCAGGALALGD